jgi:hypothetical protein
MSAQLDDLRSSLVLHDYPSTLARCGPSVARDPPGRKRPLDLLLRRSFHALRSTAAVLPRHGLRVVLVPLDVCWLRLVLARGWHGPRISTSSVSGMTGAALASAAVVLTGVRGAHFSPDHAGAIIAVVSVADCGSATVLVALVAEDLGAGPATVAGHISFRRLDVARRPLPETPFRPRGSGTSRVPRESVPRCRCPTDRSERMRCHPERVLADRE